MSEKLVEPSRIYPGLRYRDAPAMIAWLCKAFGFTERVVYPAPDGRSPMPSLPSARA